MQDLKTVFGEYYDQGNNVVKFLNLGCDWNMSGAIKM